MRIGFTGAQGTGKTTLLNKVLGLEDFKNYFRGNNIHRLLNENCNFPINKETNVYSQSAISGHIAGEVLRNLNYISDRTLVDTFAYSRISPSISYDQKKIIEDMYSPILKTYDFIFYFPIEFSLEADGVRDIDVLYQKKIDLEIQQVFFDYNIDYTILKGSIGNRLNTFIDKVKNEIKS